MASERFVLDIPIELVDVVGQMLQRSDSGPERAKQLVDDFLDQIRSRSRRTEDNHHAFFPHGNSIDREE